MATDTFILRDIPSILIVDDAPDNLELLTGALRERGYEPRPVPSGKLALMAAQADPPDLILLDIRMPEMNGYEVCERLKANEALRDIPVIFITALTETAEKVKAFAMGAVDYVTKPIQVEEVEARVRTHLMIQSLHRQLRAQNETLEQRVAEQTRELARAYKQLLELGRIKDDFLRMISYEIRTPANGVLGIGELLIDLCPASEETTRYKNLFEKSSLRLRNLIDDATLIANGETLILKNGAATSFTMLLESVQTANPEILILLDPKSRMDKIFLYGDPKLLKRAMETMVMLAISFSRNKYVVRVTGGIEMGLLRVHFDLDNLPLSFDAVDHFFEVESKARAESAAEGLGLSPVAAHRIVSAFGGDMKIIKGDGAAGYLEATFLSVPVEVPNG